MRKFALSLLASSTLLLAPALFAQTHSTTEQQNRPRAEQHNAQNMVHRHVERLAAIFNLTPEQQKQATTYFTTAWDSNRPVMMQMREDRKALHSDINAKADQSKLTSDATAIGQDQAKIVANNASAEVHFLSLLSPQDQAKYEKLQATRFAAGGFGPGHRAPGAVTR